MKNKISFFIAVITLSFIFNFLTQSSSEAAAIGCLKTADGTAIKVTAQANMFALAGTSTYDKNQCSQEPDEYKVKFYKVALCTADPYKGAADPDFSTCSNIFNNAAGTDKIIKPDTETNLLSADLILPIGTYPYLVVMVNNHLNIKHKQKYVLASDGTTDATFFGNSSGSGTYCWTIPAVTTYTTYSATDGGTMDDDPPAYGFDYNTAQGVTLVASGPGTTNARLKCGDVNAAGMDFATEIIDDLADDPDNEVYRAHFDYKDAEEDTGVTGIEMAQNLIEDDNVTLAATAIKAKRLLSHFKYTSPVVISENTVGFKMRFSTFSSVSIDMSSNGSGGTFKMWGAKVGADPFMVQVQTKTRRARGTWR